MATEAAKVLDRDPRLIQFFKCSAFNREQASHPIKSSETRNIEEIIYIQQNNRDRRIRKKIFYQVRLSEIKLSVISTESNLITLTSYVKRNYIQQTYPK